MSAVIQNEYTGNNSTTQYPFTFPYLKTSDIKASLDGVDTTAFTLPNATTLQFNTAPGSGVKIKIFRQTSVDNLTATFYAGSAIKSEDLNDNFTQNLYKTQEIGGRFISNLGGTMTGDLNMGEDTVIKFEGATDDAHETTLTVADPTADRTITLPNVTGTVVTTGDTGTVATAMIANDAINGTKLADNAVNSEHYTDGSIDRVHLAADIVDGTKIADDSINSEHYAAGSIDTEHIGNAQVTADKIADTAILTGKLAADAVNGSKIADNSIDSEHYVDGSIDNEHLANNSVSLAKMADDSVGTAELVDGSVVTAALADNSVTLAKMADSSVGTAELVNDSVTNAKIANDQIDSEHYVDQSIDTQHISDNAITNAKMADDAIGSAELGDGVIDTVHVGTAQITNAKLASNAVTTVKISDANVTTAKIANDAITIGKIGCEQTTISDSDSHIPTSGAVVDYVAAQIAPLGGLEVIATEVAFPNTQPSAGVVISISDAGGVVVNGSGTSTTGRTVGGSTVTINGFPASLQSKTMAADIGLMVSSTGSGQIYNYHKILAKEADVEQLSNDINDFAARYRVGSSNPTSDLDNGDLFFNTGTGKMLVYNGTNTAWEEVQSIGNFFISTLSPAFNGSTQNFTITNAPTNVQQILLSINGVVQKPNAGTSTPSEGFALDGNTVKLAAAPASGSDYFAVVIGSTVNIGQPSNNTVSTAVLQDDSVTQAKIAAGAVDSTELAADAVITSKVANDAITAPKIARLGGNLDFNDNAKVSLGLHNDLQIYHNGTNNFLDAISGNIRLRLNTSEDAIKCIENGAIELYHDDNKKFETTSDGVQVTGNNILLNTDTNVTGTPHTYSYTRGSQKTGGLSLYGAESALEIVSTDDGTHGGSLLIRTALDGAGFVYNPSDNALEVKTFSPSADNFTIHHGGGNTSQETQMRIVKAGAVELNHNGSKKFETLSTGAAISGDVSISGEVNLTTGGNYNRFIDASLDDGEALFIRATQGGDANHQNMAIFHRAGASELFHANSKKLSTTTTGVLVEDKVEIGANDNDVASLAVRYSTVPTTLTSSFDGTNGEGTLAINNERTSDGSAAWAGVNNSNYKSAAVRLTSRTSGADIQFWTNSSAGNPVRRCTVNSSGHFVPFANNTYDLGSTSEGWRNIYTNDLHLSNEGHSNDIDGTWGNWTIQEGESDLFLKNNRSGKKYKFNLTEVS